MHARKENVRLISDFSPSILALLHRLGVFIVGSLEDPSHGIAWCFTCPFPNKVAKWLDGFGWLGHREGHVLEPIPLDEFPDLTAPGMLGREARATYQYVRAKLQPEDLLLAIAKFNGTLDESPKPKRVPKCGACAYFHTPACPSPSPRRVWHSGETCERFFPLSRRLAETPQREALANLVAKAIE